MTVDVAKERRPKSMEIEDVSLLLTIRCGKLENYCAEINASIRLEPGKDAKVA